MLPQITSDCFATNPAIKYADFHRSIISQMEASAANPHGGRGWQALVALPFLLGLGGRSYSVLLAASVDIL